MDEEHRGGSGWSDAGVGTAARLRQQARAGLRPRRRRRWGIALAVGSSAKPLDGAAEHRHSPLPRQWAGVAYDTRRDRAVVFGGSVFNPTAGSHLVNDMAEWDPASGAWIACPTASTPPDIRFDFAFGYDPKRDVLVLFGGSGGSTRPASPSLGVVRPLDLRA